MKNLIVIGDFKNVKLNYCYVVNDLSILKATIGNRGGSENARVKHFVKLIENNQFDFDLSLILVDVDGNVIEGHHRVLAHTIKKIPVVVRIVNPKNLSEISNFHSGMNPKWKPEQNFGAAISNGSEVAIMLDEMRDTLVKKFGVILKKISAPEMYGILLKNIKYFSSGKNAPTVEMWSNTDLISVAKSREFKKNLALFIEMKRELISNRDADKIGKQVMKMYFNNEIDLGIFVSSLKYGFTLSVYNVETISDKVMSMYKKQCNVAA